KPAGRARRIVSTPVRLTRIVTVVMSSPKKSRISGPRTPIAVRSISSTKAMPNSTARGSQLAPPVMPRGSTASSQELPTAAADGVVDGDVHHREVHGTEEGTLDRAEAADDRGEEDLDALVGAEGCRAHRVLVGGEEDTGGCGHEPRDGECDQSGADEVDPEGL